jgi:putative ABC transport system permease protein
MLFLILTVGTGLFNASAARTMNGNMEDQIRYAGGSDLVLRQLWMSNAPPPSIPGAPGMGANETGMPEKISYLEPPFEVFKSFPGVEAAARVFVKDEAFVTHGAADAKARLIGIDTDDFGRTAWMKENLLPYHFYDYLNLIASDPYAVLVSRTMADRLSVKEGDTLQVSWAGLDSMQARVYGIIDYFPTFNPNPAAGDGANGGNAAPPLLIVAHLETIQNELALEPYDVWIKLKTGGVEERELLFESMEKRGISLVSIEDTYDKITDSRNDPFRMAMNGVMSLGFIISLAISFVGFLLYWVLALQGRMLQLGIFRAMGISFLQMLGMLSVEQALTSGAGFFIGLICGITAGTVFVPMFQLSFDPGKIVPPFEVMFQPGDLLQLLLMTMCMLSTALVILGWMLKGMKIYQAVKLGED